MSVNEEINNNRSTHPLPLILSVVLCEKSGGKDEKENQSKVLSNICDNYCKDNDFVPIDGSAPIF